MAMLKEKREDESNEDNTKQVKQVIVILESGEELVSPLPPITDIEIPQTTTQSARIRWLYALGYEVKEISAFLGVRYQMVRNITHTIPKRAAREDQPLLKVKYKPEKHIIEDALDGALDASLLEDRKERLAKEKADRRELLRGPKEGEGDEEGGEDE